MSKVITESCTARLAATPDRISIYVSPDSSGRFCTGYPDLFVPWSDVLKHIPTEALVGALKVRPELYIAETDRTNFKLHGRFRGRG